MNRLGLPLSQAGRWSLRNVYILVAPAAARCHVRSTYGISKACWWTLAACIIQRADPQNSLQGSLGTLSECSTLPKVCARWSGVLVCRAGECCSTAHHKLESDSLFTCVCLSRVMVHGKLHTLNKSKGDSLVFPGFPAKSRHRKSETHTRPLK